MLFSDVILVLGRLLDIGHVGLEPLAYAASLYLVVTGWMMLASIMFGNMPSVWKMLRERPIWAFAAAVSNGGSYLTLFMLLGMMPVTLIEAVSALAGIGATVVGVFGFHEHDRRRKIIATMVMTLATILLLYDHRGILRVQ
jgi:drug/metabolite transporter (DMT)-like permease